MFGRIGFGFQNLFGREGLEVAQLPRPMEEWRANEWQLTHQTHSISMLRWMAALGQEEPFRPRRLSGREGSNFPVPGRGWEGLESAQPRRSLRHR
jgi:hypothetical protein